MLIQALFILVKKWKQPKYLSSKMWHSPTMEYYLATKKEQSTDTWYNMADSLKH